jgi:hypothetical protein
MADQPTSAASLLARAEDAWASGDGETAMSLFDRADQVGESQGDLAVRAAAVLGLARGQEYNLTPGRLAVRLHTTYEAVDAPALRARLASALARCWAYASEPHRARPFAIEALHLADREDDPILQADALDAALASHWGPDEVAQRREWAVRLDDAAAHLVDPDARLQAQLWMLTVAWEVLDLPRMHRSMRAIEQLAEESARAEFFAASRRLPLELLRDRHDLTAQLVERAEAAARVAVIPDADAVLHEMRGYGAFFAGNAAGCAAEAPAFERYGVDLGVITVRAEAAVQWMGAGRPDKVAEMLGAFTADVLAGLPHDSDWLLVLQCVLEGALFVRDLALVRDVVQLLVPYSGRSVVNAGGVQWHGVTDDTLARANALLGDHDASASHAAAALATYERVGATWWGDRLREELQDTPVADDVVHVHLHPQPGGLWLVGRQGATFVLPRMRGLEHLHQLLERPGADVPAARLVGGEVVEQRGMEVLDDESRKVLGARLAELDAELAQSELAQSERSELREERDSIARYLASGSGLGGRARTGGDNDERARVAVRKAIVAALARIAEADPWLGRHLHERVRTGFECRYDPDPDVDWLLRTPG